MKSEIEIIFEYNEERDHQECFWKGCRNDVIVRTNTSRYRLSIINLKRLQQEYEDSIESDRYYCSDPNTILVRNVTPEEIMYTIHRLHERGYFDKLDRYGFDICNIRRKKWR